MLMTAGIDRQARATAARLPGRPKSTLKSFALALPEYEELEPQLSNAKSMKARSQRISSMATGLLKGLEASSRALKTF